MVETWLHTNPSATWKDVMEPVGKLLDVAIAQTIMNVSPDKGKPHPSQLMERGHTSPTPNTQGLCTSCVHSIGGCGFVIGTCSVGDKTQIPCSNTAVAHQADPTRAAASRMMVSFSNLTSLCGWNIFGPLRGYRMKGQPPVCLEWGKECPLHCW